MRKHRKHGDQHGGRDIALVASDGNENGIVLAHDGDSMHAEIGGYSCHVGDHHDLTKAPEGLSIWEGYIEYAGGDGDCDVYFRGAFRELTPSERMRYALTGCPWPTD